MLLRYFVPDLDYSDMAVHAVLLADRVRVEAYSAAIAQAVTPGSRVVELGAGVGVFGRQAAHLGAEVFLVERESQPVMISRLLDTLLAPTHLISAISESIEDVSLPACDIVIHELLGPRLLDEGLARLLAAFAKNNPWYNSPSTRVLPRSVSLWCQAVLLESTADSDTLPHWTESASHAKTTSDLRCIPPLVWATEPNDAVPRSNWTLVATLDTKRPCEWPSAFEVSVDIFARANALLWGFTADLNGLVELDVRLGTGPRTTWGGVMERFPNATSVSAGSYVLCGKLPGAHGHKVEENGPWLIGIQPLNKFGTIDRHRPAQYSEIL